MHELLIKFIHHLYVGSSCIYCMAKFETKSFQNKQNITLRFLYEKKLAPKKSRRVLVTQIAPIVEL